LRFFSPFLFLMLLLLASCTSSDDQGIKKLTDQEKEKAIREIDKKINRQMTPILHKDKLTKPELQRMALYFCGDGLPYIMGEDYVSHYKEVELEFIERTNIDADQSEEIVADCQTYDSFFMIVIEQVHGKWTKTRRFDYIIDQENQIIPIMGSGAAGFIQPGRPVRILDCIKDGGMCVYELKGEKLNDSFVDVDSETLDQIYSLDRIDLYFTPDEFKLYFPYYKLVDRIDIKDINKDGLLEIPKLNYDPKKKEAFIEWYQFTDVKKFTRVKTEKYIADPDEYWRNHQTDLKKNPKYNQLLGFGQKDRYGRTPLQAVIDLELAIQQKNEKVVREIAEKNLADELVMIWDLNGGKMGNKDSKLQPCYIYQYKTKNNNSFAISVEYKANQESDDSDLVDGNYKADFVNGVWKISRSTESFKENNEYDEVLEIDHK
jgi:hypothetical protein